ncbi:MAG: hypothetical protein CL944_00910 [Candidatus Diapherotrites archaeon]|uniref:50S ribosomal protein L34e n=1 Tax=Candidatus Iainarchaeum sp. TaxID=3101447 RepID=A0A2D6LPA5_9ARCH|nr:hypothetical protein [Candidatus Diapherotrites archaeon]|tara:strand:+ start:9379 stop:9714 length:336 start_codon:yes stop_codon:yes gene_type:complete
MVDRQTRVKKKKFRKTPGSNTAIQYTRDKNSKARDPITGKQLSGTGNQSKAIVRGLAKSKRRPSVAFGGILGSKTRREVWENYALVDSGRKDITDIPIKLKKFVKVKEASK